MRKFFSKKKIIWTIIILAVGGLAAARFFKGTDNSKNIQTDTVKKQDLQRTVLATGQVISKTDLDLSFKMGGIVRKVSVKEGQAVTEGTILAQLDQKDLLASLTSARGSLAQAKANYEKVLAGASNEDVAVTMRAVESAQVAVDNAKKALETTKKQQDTAVKNSYSSLLNTSVQAIPSTANVGSATVSLSGTYTGTEQGVYKVTVYNSGSGLRFQINGLENGEGEVKTVPVPFGTKGLYIQFTGTVYTSDSWSVSIPNTYASTYVTNYNAYQTALQTRDAAISSAEATVATAESTLAQQQAALDLKKAQARPADIQGVQAQILSATGQVQAAEANLENTILRAPVSGVITKVDVKVGEQASPSKLAIVLQDVNNVHIEANISEANIVDIKPDQPIELTFDPLGPDRIFQGKVQIIDPASTLISGVVNYKITASMDMIPEIKPGMSANMTILTQQKKGVIAIPLRAILSKNSKKIVRVVDDPIKKTYHETEIKTGIEADGGLVEVVSGLNEGQEIVTFIKTK